MQATPATLLEDERDYPWQWITPVIWSEADLRYRAAHVRFEEDNHERLVRKHSNA